MVKIQLDAYLDRLKGAEAYQRSNERRHVPTYAELASESGISPVTLSRIANGHIKQLNLGVLGSLIASLRRRGFATEISDLLVYHEDSVNEVRPTVEVMKAFRELAYQELKLQQPSARKQFYELRAGGELVGTLHWPKTFGTTCVAESANGTWIFQRQGFFRLRVTVRQIASEQDLLVYTPKWTGMEGTIEHSDGREFGLRGASWWGDSFLLVQKPAPDIEVELLAVKINFGFLRGSADVVAQPQLMQTQDASLLALFGCYLATMAYYEMSSGTA